MIDRRIFLQLSGGVVAGAAGLSASLGAVLASHPAETAEPGAGEGAAGLSTLLSNTQRTIGERLSLASASRFTLLPVAGQPRGVAPGPLMPGEVMLGQEDEFTHDDPAFALIGGNPLDRAPGGLDIETWLRGAGGQGLWDEAAARFGWKPLLVGTTGGIGAHIWSRVPLRMPTDLKGVRFAAPLPLHAALKALGAVPMPHRHEDMLLAWRFGVIDAVQVPDAGASLAVAMTGRRGVHWYTGGLASQRRVISLRVPLAEWQSLSPADQTIFEAVAAETAATMRANSRAQRHQLVRQIARLHGQEPIPLATSIRVEIGEAARRDLDMRAADDPGLAALLTALAPAGAHMVDPHIDDQADMTS